MDYFSVLLPSSQERIDLSSCFLVITMPYVWIKIQLKLLRVCYSGSNHSGGKSVGVLMTIDVLQIPAGSCFSIHSLIYYLFLLSIECQVSVESIVTYINIRLPTQNLSLVDQTTPSTALDVLHHQHSDAIHPALRREWSGQRDYPESQLNFSLFSLYSQDYSWVLYTVTITITPL